MMKEWQVRTLKDLKELVKNTILWPDPVLHAEINKTMTKLEAEALEGHWKEFYIGKLALLKDEVQDRLQRSVRR